MTGQARVDLLNCADGGEDLPRRAVAALESIAVHEGSLHRVKFVACGYAFNRNDVLATATSRRNSHAAKWEFRQETPGQNCLGRLRFGL